MSKKSVKQVRRKHGDEFRRNAISMVEDHGYTTTQAARELGINQNLLRTL
jgi:transposase